MSGGPPDVPPCLCKLVTYITYMNPGPPKRTFHGFAESCAGDLCMVCLHVRVRVHVRVGVRARVQGP